MWEAISGSAALGPRGSGGHARQVMEGVTEQIPLGQVGCHPLGNPGSQREMCSSELPLTQEVTESHTLF